MTGPASDETMPSICHSGDDDLRHTDLGGIGQACASPTKDEYRALVDAIGDWVWEIDESGIITYASPRAKSLIGYEPWELIGKKYMNCLPEREKPHIAKLFQMFSAARQPRSPIEHFELSKQGNEIPVETAIVSIIEGDGVFKGYRGITREISVRKRVERDRDFNAAVLQSVSQVSPDGFLLVDPQGNILSYNRRFLDIWNISTELTAGKRDAPLLRLVSTKVSNKEEFLARIKALYANAVETAHEEVSLKDGRTLERYTTPIRLDNGTYLGRVWFFRDISAAKRAEAKIREDEAQFRVLVEQEVAGIYMISADGAVAYVNSRFSDMLGYAVAEVIGHPFLEFVAEPDREEVVRQFALLMSAKQAIVKLQLALKRKDGHFVDMLTYGSLAIHNGQPTAIGVAIDVTEHKQFEKTLRASEERFRLLVEQAPEAILVYDADRESFIQANKIAESLFGCDRDDLLKLGPLHFYCPVQPGGRSADVTFAKNVERALKGETVKFERRICATDGREVLLPSGADPPSLGRG